ncbi:GDP-mannose 4,6-dehydratase [Candidatus Woesearchaeota archaeon]|nr:GDP-mannose 4,6-dehydratase [Candidatus Woesearchaeota archaeon]
MKNALITGITGQDGSYLAELLLEKGYNVFGLIRRLSTPNLWRIEGILDKIELIEGDLTDQASVNNAVIKAKPDEIYNLAAQSFVGTSWSQPVLTSNVNYHGCVRMLEAMKQFAPKAKFYQASTSEMYGNSHNGDYTQDETTPFKPTSPYAISKLAAHMITINYRESYNLFACCGILFNHESPRRGIEFVTRKITDAVARIKHGKQDKLKLGNLDAKRDWGFAPDYVELMWKMLQLDTPEDFVAATGETHSVREFCDAAFKAAEIDDWEKYVEVDERFKRPSELHILKGVPDYAKKRLEWEPTVKFEELVKIMVEADLKTH